MTLEDDLKKAGVDPNKIRIEEAKEEIIKQAETQEEPKDVDALEEELNSIGVDLTEEEIEKEATAEAIAIIEDKKRQMDDILKEETPEEKEIKAVETKAPTIDPKTTPQQIEQEEKDPIPIYFELKEKEKIMNDIKQVDIRAASCSKKLENIVANMKEMKSLSKDFIEIIDSINDVVSNTIKAVKALSSIQINEIK